MNDLLKNTLGVTIDEVEKMDRDALHDLYEKAMINEEVKAVEALEKTKNGKSKEADAAAKVVDWLYKKLK